MTTNDGCRADVRKARAEAAGVDPTAAAVRAAQAEAWDEAVQALAWALDNGPTAAALAYVAKNNPYRADRLATDTAAPEREVVPIERDLWWGHLCPALSNINALKKAQSDLVALGADWAEAGRILPHVQRFYVDAAHKAARRYLAAVPATPVAVEGVETVEWGVRCAHWRRVYTYACRETAKDALTHEGDVIVRRVNGGEWSPVEPETSEPEGGESRG